MADPMTSSASEPIMAARSGELVQVSPLVRRLVAPNASPFTATGTCTYLVGVDEIAIIDPGPADAAHISALLSALGPAPLGHIFITHTHRDHSPAAAKLREATGAPIIGAAPFSSSSGAPEGFDTAHDLDYRPDRILADGELVAGRGYALRAIATPGHSANHLAFALEAEKALFSGDHVMAWSTTVVAPPDGAMGAYMASLEKLRRRDDAIYWPGHGGPVLDPQRYVKGLAAHRRQREASILARLEAGETSIAEIVEKIYVGLNPALRGAAMLSTQAHLIDLAERGMVEASSGYGVASRFRRRG